MGGKVRGERVECLLYRIIIGNAGCRAAKPLEPSGTLPIIGEQAVDIGPDDPAVR